jgi:hypothetical protein
MDAILSAACSRLGRHGRTKDAQGMHPWSGHPRPKNRMDFSGADACEASAGMTSSVKSYPFENVR